MSYKLKSRWLSSAKYPRKSPYAMTPQGIVVHNTAGDASAAEEAAAMVGNSSAVSFHVVIDEEYAVECIPFSRNAFHAGDGAQGYANRNLIGIEIARSAEESGDRFRRAEENAALYIAHVCVQYGWTSAQLHQHNWYSATECPHRTKAHWSDFLAKVDENIATIKASSEDHPAPSAHRSHSSPSEKPSTSPQKTETAPSTPQSAPSAKRWALRSSGKTAR